MSMANMRRGIPSLFKQGSRQLSGLEGAILQNIEACKELADIVRSSFGPNGMNKMVINYLQKLFVTSDAATILREMEVNHPAAKLSVMASDMQEQEVGDGSNFVVILIGEVLLRAADLLKQGLHPSELVRGFKLAHEQAQKELPELVAWQADNVCDEAQLAVGMRAAVAAKLHGLEGVLAPLVAKAAAIAMPTRSGAVTTTGQHGQGQSAQVGQFRTDNIRCVKVLGGGVQDSEVVAGMVIKRGVEGTVRRVTDAKVLLFTCSVDAASTETKGTVLIKDAEQLLGFAGQEEQRMHTMIKAWADAGVRVVVSGEKVGELALHFLEKYGIMVLRVASKFELRRIARTLGCKPRVQLVDHVPTEDLGFCSSIYEREIGGSKVTVLEQAQGDARIATVLVRGSTDNMLEDVERAVDDAVNTVKAMGRDPRFVAGAGACEVELSRRLTAMADEVTGLEQYAVKAFADALKVVPRTLAENAGMDATETVTELFASHAESPDNAHVGIDIMERKVADVSGSPNFVLDSLAAKSSAIRLAMGVVDTVLSVDRLIMAKAAGGPKVPKPQGHWDN